MATTESATTTDPRTGPPTVSVSRVISSGARPPTARPIRAHITRFPWKVGIEPHMLVAVKPRVAIR